MLCNITTIYKTLFLLRYNQLDDCPSTRIHKLLFRRHIHLTEDSTTLLQKPKGLYCNCPTAINSTRDLFPPLIPPVPWGLPGHIAQACNCCRALSCSGHQSKPTALHNTYYMNEIRTPRFGTCRLQNQKKPTRSGASCFLLGGGRLMM